MEEEFGVNANGDAYQQHLIQPREITPEMQELMDIVEQAVAGIDKKVASEIKNLK